MERPKQTTQNYTQPYHHQHTHKNNHTLHHHALTTLTLLTTINISPIHRPYLFFVPQQQPSSYPSNTRNNPLHTRNPGDTPAARRKVKLKSTGRQIIRPRSPCTSSETNHFSRHDLRSLAATSQPTTCMLSLMQRVSYVSYTRGMDVCGGFSAIRQARVVRVL